MRGTFTLLHKISTFIEGSEEGGFISTPSIMLLMIAFFCSGQIQYFYSRLDTLTWSGHLPAGEDDGKFIIIDEPTGQPD